MGNGVQPKNQYHTQYQKQMMGMNQNQYPNEMMGMNQYPNQGIGSMDKQRMMRNARQALLAAVNTFFDTMEQTSRRQSMNEMMYQPMNGMNGMNGHPKNGMGGSMANQMDIPSAGVQRCPNNKRFTFNF